MSNRSLAVALAGLSLSALSLSVSVSGAEPLNAPDGDGQIDAYLACLNDEPPLAESFLEGIVRNWWERSRRDFLHETPDVIPSKEAWVPVPSELSAHRSLREEQGFSPNLESPQILIFLRSDHWAKVEESRVVTRQMNGRWEVDLFRKAENSTPQNSDAVYLSVG